MRMKSSDLFSRLLSLQIPFLLPAKYGIFLCFVTSVIFLKSGQCCHPDNQDFIRCFHVYLERDFVTVQSYLEQYNSRGARRVLMEGPTLDEICDKIKEMDRCFEEESRHGCFGFVDLEPMHRLLHALRSLTDYFCSGDKDRLIAFLKYGGCVLNFQRTLRECQDEALNWPIFWARIFRLEETHRICDSLYDQSACVQRYLPDSSCDTTAVVVYNDTMRTWLDNWCNSCSWLRASGAVVLSCLVLVGRKTVADLLFS